MDNKRTNADARRYLTYNAAVKYTMLSRHTIWRAAERGEIPRIVVGTSVRFDKADLDRWLAQRKQRTAT